MSYSVRLHRRQPTRLPHPWDSPGKNTGVGCHFLLQCMIVKSESELAQSCPTLGTPWTAAHQAPPSMGFSRQEYWSGVPLPTEQLITCICSDLCLVYILIFINVMFSLLHFLFRFFLFSYLNKCIYKQKYYAIVIKSPKDFFRNEKIV